MIHVAVIITEQDKKPRDEFCKDNNKPTVPDWYMYAKVTNYRA